MAMKLKTFLCGAAASLGVFLGAAQSQQPQQAGKDLVWAYPVPDPPPTATDDKAPKKLPGSAKSYTQAQIDEILDKISQSGYQSLTEEEKRLLFEASKKLN